MVQYFEYFLPHLTERISAHIHVAGTTHAIDLTTVAHLNQARGSSWTVDVTGFGGQAHVHAPIGEVVKVVAIVGKGFVV